MYIRTFSAPQRGIPVNGVLYLQNFGIVLAQKGEIRDMSLEVVFNATKRYCEMAFG